MQKLRNPNRKWLDIMLQRLYEKVEPSEKYINIIRKATDDLIEITTGDVKYAVEQYAKWHSKRLAFDVEYCSENFLGKKILECGSFPLIGTRAMSIAGLDVQGLDLHAQRYIEIQDALNIHVSEGNIETEAFPFEDNTFDVVLFNEVFEHLRINLNFTFREVKRVLKPGGVLMLSTPNLYSVLGLYRFLVHGKAGIYTDVYDAYNSLETKGHADHIREYSPVEIIDFLDKIGFDTVKIIHRGEYKRRSLAAISKVMPKLRPFFSVHAIKQR